MGSISLYERPVSDCVLSRETACEISVNWISRSISGSKQGLFKGGGRQRARSYGRPSNLADMQPTYRELTASWHITMEQIRNAFEKWRALSIARTKTIRTIVIWRRRSRRVSPFKRRSIWSSKEKTPRTVTPNQCCMAAAAN